MNKINPSLYASRIDKWRHEPWLAVCIEVNQDIVTHTNYGTLEFRDWIVKLLSDNKDWYWKFNKQETEYQFLFKNTQDIILFLQQFLDTIDD